MPTLVVTPQLVAGVATSGANCGPAAGATQVKWVTNGNDQPTALDVRRLIRTPAGLPDLGPTNLRQVSEAIARGWGVRTDIESPIRFEELWDRLRDGKTCAHVAIWYGALLGTKHYASKSGFIGNHSAVAAEADDDDVNVAEALADGRTGVPSGPQRWPKALLRRACGALNVEGEPLGQGWAIAGFSEAQAIAPQPSEGVNVIDLVPMTLRRRVPVPAGTVLRKVPDAKGAKHSTVSKAVSLGLIGAHDAEWYVVASGDRGVYVKRSEVGKPVVADANVGK